MAVTIDHKDELLFLGAERKREFIIADLSRDAKNENSVSQGENGVLTRIQKSSGYSPEA